jgi:hypothetical protein
MAIHIGRREFVAALGGAAVTWQLATGGDVPPALSARADEIIE